MSVSRSADINYSLAAVLVDASGETEGSRAGRSCLVSPEGRALRGDEESGEVHAGGTHNTEEFVTYVRIVGQTPTRRSRYEPRYASNIRSAPSASQNQELDRNFATTKHLS